MVFSFTPHKNLIERGKIILTSYFSVMDQNGVIGQLKKLKKSQNQKYALKLLLANLVLKLC